MTTNELKDDDKFLLIDCVKAAPALWDVSNKNYKLKNMMTKLNSRKRAQFNFKSEIMAILQQFEKFLLDEEDGILEAAEDVGANLTI